MKESKYLTIEEALKSGSTNIHLRGWVYRERKSNKFIFIVLRDESDIIQCVISKAKSPEIFEKAEKLNPPQERRTKQILTKNLELDNEKTQKEAEAKGIVFPGNLQKKLESLPLYESKND